MTPSSPHNAHNAHGSDGSARGSPGAHPARASNTLAVALPLSVIALSILAAVRLSPWSKRRLYSRSSHTSDSAGAGPSTAADRSAEQLPEKKSKRPKERRRRAKDLSKEIESKLARTSRPQHVSAGTRRTDELSSAAIAEGADDSGDEDAGGSQAVGRARKRRPISSLLLTPLPLPPSSLTINALVNALQGLQTPRRQLDERTRLVPSPDTDETIPVQIRRPSSPSPSNATSVLSGTLSTAESSGLSPRTPPQSLPSSQSLPPAAYALYNHNINNDETSYWASTTASYDDMYVNDPIDDRPMTARIPASVSAPAWDSSLDWHSAPVPIEAKSPEVSAQSTPVIDVLFPSLHDPPASTDLYYESAVLSDEQSLQTALEASINREQKWKAESERLGAECDRLRWAWTDDTRRWSQRETELQHQLYRIMSIHSSPQQLSLPSPGNGAFALFTPPTSAKRADSPHGRYTRRPSMNYNNRSNSNFNKAKSVRSMSTSVSSSRGQSLSRASSPFSMSMPPTSYPVYSNTSSAKSALSTASSSEHGDENVVEDEDEEEGKDTEQGGEEGAEEDDDDDDGIPDDLASAILKEPSLVRSRSRSSSRAFSNTSGAISAIE